MARGADFVERIEPRHTKNDIVLSATNVRVLLGLAKEFRRADDVRRHGLPVRSKLLFCGPPGCGKTTTSATSAPASTPIRAGRHPDRRTPPITRSSVISKRSGPSSGAIASAFVSGKTVSSTLTISSPERHTSSISNFGISATAGFASASSVRSSRTLRRARARCSTNTELMKKLLASYGRDEEFRAVVEQIIDEEEKKNNRVLANSLRRTLEAGPSRPSAPNALAPLIPFPEAAARSMRKEQGFDLHRLIGQSGRAAPIALRARRPPFGRAGSGRDRRTPASEGVAASPRRRQARCAASYYGQQGLAAGAGAAAVLTPFQALRQTDKPKVIVTRHRRTNSGGRLGAHVPGLSPRLIHDRAVEVTLLQPACGAR
jgi:hypothetical protein